MSTRAQDERRGRVVVGTDGSPESLAAVRWAVDVAARTDAYLEVVHVWRPVIEFGWLGAAPLHGWRSEPARDGHALLDTVLATIGSKDRPVRLRSFVIEGDPAQCLIAHALGADVLVLGDRGTGGFAGLRLGSVASACATYAPCPVVIVPSAHHTSNPQHVRVDRRMEVSP